jgi:hypothetical protein
MTPRQREKLRNDTYSRLLPRIIHGLCSNKAVIQQRSSKEIADHADDIARELASLATATIETHERFRFNEEASLSEKLSGGNVPSNPDQKDDPKTNARILNEILPPLRHESCTGKLFCDCPTCRKEWK